MAAPIPTVFIGGIARNFGDSGSSYRIGAPDGAVRDRRRRIRQRVLRQDREVSQISARYRRHQQHRVRSRRHLRRPRRGSAGLSAACQPRAARGSDRDWRRQPGRRRAGAAGAEPRADVRHGRGSRLAGGRYHVRRAAARGFRLLEQGVDRGYFDGPARRRAQRPQCAGGDCRRP